MPGIVAAAMLLLILPGCGGQPTGHEPASETKAGKAQLEARTRARPVDWTQPYLVVEPETTRAIQGIAEVDRKRYFAISDSGRGFDRRVRDEAMYDYLVHELGIAFGRDLGIVRSAARRLREDASRPGFADLMPLKNRKPEPPSERMLADFGPNLDVAAHGAHNAFPEFMGRYATKQSSAGDHPQYIPQNLEAAAELSAAVLKYAHTDFDRPRYYEPINEPHWSFYKDPHLAEWHLKTMEAVHRSTPEVKVGGLCMPVSYFYRNDYRAFDGLKGFIDNTGCRMDFYSFHVYDYLRWTNGVFGGRFQSGLALENSLDLVANYSAIAYGKEVGIVVSEHGGYIHGQPKGMYSGELVAEEIVKRHFPDVTGFERELKKRSIVCFAHASTIIANTLAFMDHPHTVWKAVPFLLLNTWSWDPKYYANLYVPYGYTDRSRWVEMPLTSFYKLFQGVGGRRVKALCSDPDLQARAFVNGSRLYLAVNNLANRPQSVALHGIDTPRVEMRRFGRNPDYTAYFRRQIVPTPERLELAPREAVVLVADYGAPIGERRRVNEVVCYGDGITRPLGQAVFKIRVPVEKKIDYAILRIGLTRPAGRSRTPIVRLNGEELQVPLEDCADRFTEREYAITKLIPLDPRQLRAENTVEVKFPDGNEGVVGSVVVRAAVEEA
ncbi:MAG: beta-agarase, partial [Verrucomicrobia bacterium]